MAIVFPLALPLLLPMMAEPRPVAAKPNIVFVLADDLGYGELGCYGNTFNETPRIDAFAKESVRFAEAYAMPVCSPTRSSLMTGKYPVRTGIVNFLDAGAPVFLDPKKEYALPRLLDDAGYHTTLIGKWHLDTRYRRQVGTPQAHGFQEVIATETKYIADGDYTFPYDKIDTLKTGAEGEYLVDRMTDEAIGVVRRAAKSGARDGSKPFFLYLSHYAVHTRLEAPPTTAAKYERKFGKRYGEAQLEAFRAKPNHFQKPDNPWLAAMLERIDVGFGRLLDTLKAEGLDRNTIVVFLSDNGGDGRVANNGPLRGAKASLYEGGIRVPQIIRYPGVTKPRLDAQPTLATDFYPTFAGIVGQSYPHPEEVDGRSILENIKGERAKSRELFWHHAGIAGTPAPVNAGDAFRADGYKLVNTYRTGRYELFNIEKDPAESKDLASAEPDRLATMRKRLDAWRAERKIAVPAPSSELRGNDDPAM